MAVPVIIAIILMTQVLVTDFFWFEEGVNDMFFSLCKEVFFKEEGKGLVLVPLMVDIMILVTSVFFHREGATAWCWFH